MSAAGMTMLLTAIQKSTGVDFGKVAQDFIELKSTVETTLAGINTKLEAIRIQNEEILKCLMKNNAQQNQPPQPLALPQTPQPQPMTQPEKPLLQPQPQNQQPQT